MMAHRARVVSKGEHAQHVGWRKLLQPPPTHLCMCEHGAGRLVLWYEVAPALLVLVGLDPTYVFNAKEAPSVCLVGAVWCGAWHSPGARVCVWRVQCRKERAARLKQHTTPREPRRLLPCTRSLVQAVPPSVQALFAATPPGGREGGWAARPSRKRSTAFVNSLLLTGLARSPSIFLRAPPIPQKQQPSSKPPSAQATTHRKTKLGVSAMSWMRRS
jgi:hypothetical protein